MNPRLILLSAAGLALVAMLGFGVGRLSAVQPKAAAPAPQNGRRILYWYDPMIPMERHTGPGKSSMNMTLIPKYADEGSGSPGLQIDPAKAQNLGVRLASVERGTLPSGVSATGVIDFNARDVAVVQAKAAGFVERTYARAPGDVVAPGAPLVDLLIPEWSGAQGEFLAVKRTADPALIQASRERLRLLGMPPALIDQVARTDQVRNVVTVSTPTGGMIKMLGVRAGMSVMAGQTLAEIDGLSRVWLNVAVPEAMAGQIYPGQSVAATLGAYPGQSFNGRVTAILPQTDMASHTLTARIELPNSGGRLKPGMFASARFGGSSRPTLLAPSEAVIRTGLRNLVMVAQPGGRYVPAEVRIGREAEGRTEILAGLSEGEKVVASGQFLIDSEASLSELKPRPLSNMAPAPNSDASAPSSQPASYESEGRVEQIGAASITLSQKPTPALGWPAMTRTFRLADPSLSQGIKVGDQVAFSFDRPPGGPRVLGLSKVTAP